MAINIIWYNLGEAVGYSCRVCFNTQGS
jgi:hypothetical protein